MAEFVIHNVCYNPVRDAWIIEDGVNTNQRVSRHKTSQPNTSPRLSSPGAASAPCDVDVRKRNRRRKISGYVAQERAEITMLPVGA